MVSRTNTSPATRRASRSGRSPPAATYRPVSSWSNVVMCWCSLPESAREPAVCADDGLRALRQFHGCVALVGPVADLFAQDPVGLELVALGLHDVGKAQSGALAMGVCVVGDVGGGAGLDRVAGRERLGDDDEGDVGDPSARHEVDAVRLVREPCPPFLAQLAERLGLPDEPERGAEVGDTLGAAAGLPALA